jgi:hypothetical protein
VQKLTKFNSYFRGGTEKKEDKIPQLNSEGKSIVNFRANCKITDKLHS